MRILSEIVGSTESRIVYEENGAIAVLRCPSGVSLDEMRLRLRGREPGAETKGDGGAEPAAEPAEPGSADANPSAEPAKTVPRGAARHASKPRKGAPRAGSAGE